MEIVSFGKQIRKGEYKIHSRFNSAINFISGDTFVFIVNESIGAGPVNIVVNGIVSQLAGSLEIEDSLIKINGTEYGFESNKLFDSSIDLSTYDYELFVQNLSIVERVVAEKAPPKSLSFLLKEITGGFEQTTPLSPFAKGDFEKECRRIIKAGVEQILYGDVLTGVKMIKGLGPGLTPSGDDFNSGLLIAMNVANNMYDNTEIKKPLRFRKTSEVSEQVIITGVYQAAIGKNLFTNSFLSCAANGNLFYKFRELIRTLQYTNVKEIINSTELVMTMGETSGADQLTGFLIGMKRFLK